MTEEKMDATTAKLKALLDAGNIDLKNPETVKAFLRIPATVARESCRRIGDLYQDAAKRGVDAPEAPDEETLGLIDQEHRALFFLSALFLGQFPRQDPSGLGRRSAREVARRLYSWQSLREEPGLRGRHGRGRDAELHPYFLERLQQIRDV